MQSAKWYGDRFKQSLENPKKDYVMKCGFFVEGKAKKILTEKVYDQPQRGSYKRTGTLRSSIHTKYDPLEVAAYVGTSAERMRSISGTVVFYAPYVEFGHRLRNGEYYPGRPHLRPALDELKAELRLR